MLFSHSLNPLSVLKQASIRGAKGAAKLAGLGILAGGAGLAWGLAGTRDFKVRHRTIVCDPDIAREDNMGEFPEKPLRILHLSDLHLRASQDAKQKWIVSLADYEPDLVVVTGDLIAEADALPYLCEIMKPFWDVPTVYVYGSNDYFAPQFKNPFAYLIGPSAHKDDSERVELPWRDMDAVFQKAGWLNLNNARGHYDIDGWSIDFVGVDDPHISYDRYPGVLSEDSVDASVGDAARSRAHLKIGVTHAPYTRILDAMSEEKCHVIFAGHTHGGQVCLPKAGALVTNCDLPRLYASGLFQWPPTGEEPRCADAQVHFGQRATVTALTTPDQPKAGLYEEAEALRVSRPDWLPSRGVRRAWVNVSAGLGTSPFAPVRIACPPEAIVIDIVRG